MAIDRWLNIVVIMAVCSNIITSIWGYYDARAQLTALDARAGAIEHRQDRLADAYIRNDAAIDALKEKTALLEGRIIATSPEDARRSAETLKRLEAK